MEDIIIAAPPRRPLAVAATFCHSHEVRGDMDQWRGTGREKEFGELNMSTSPFTTSRWQVVMKWSITAGFKCCF
jgi:hypothetical protein